jgi:ribosome-associated translation inhibitor RaiA
MDRRAVHTKEAGMIVSIVYRDAGPSPAVKRLVEAAGASLVPFFRRVVSLDWTLGREAALVVVTCRVHSASGYYRAHARARTLVEAIDEVVDRLTTQRRRRKAALARHRWAGVAAGRRSGADEKRKRVAR